MDQAKLLQMQLPDPEIVTVDKTKFYSELHVRRLLAMLNEALSQRDACIRKFQGEVAVIWTAAHADEIVLRKARETV